MQITVAMFWECTANDPIAPKEALVLHFVDAPREGNFYEDPTGSLCKLAALSGKPTVQMTEDAWGSKYGGFQNNQELLLNGRPFPLPKGFVFLATIGGQRPYADVFNRAVGYK
ncbi:MAG: hypothetical protein M3Y50_15350 [Acidobacteriota bacterium]|nr:hypothetical protein [Acidobacteriota bacterium]